MESFDLRERLVAAYGDGPRWEVKYHRYKTHIEGTYGFFVAFDRGTSRSLKLAHWSTRSETVYR